MSGGGQEHVPEDLRSGTVQDDASGIGRGSHLTGEADGPQDARGVHEHNPLTRPTSKLVREGLTASLPRPRVGEIGLEGLPGLRWATADVNEPGLLPGDRGGER